MSRQSNSGVTQLELLVSLSVMGLVAILLANAMNFSRQALLRTDTALTAKDAHVMRSRLVQWAENMPLDYHGDTARSLLLGTTTSLGFSASIDAYGLSPTQRSWISLATQAQENTLVMTLEGISASGEQPQTFSSVLAKNTTKFSLSYFGRLSTEPSSRWHDEWSDPVYLPNLVKIEWQTPSGPIPPITFQPARKERQRLISLSSLLPPK